MCEVVLKNLRFAVTLNCTVKVIVVLVSDAVYMSLMLEFLAEFNFVIADGPHLVCKFWLS